ncbi:MAG: DNA replication/repair protein RecF [Myxococcota bacterium]|jgi:DNA replication and repair protein RecF|nr:DNA replication/repair protein RecF [Myxococcota bacterium]
MRLVSLRLRAFRNLAEALFEPHPRFNIIAGANAQGKSNLLEAVHVLATMRSFRTHRAAELVHFDAKMARLDAVLERTVSRRNVRIEFDARSRRAWIDERFVRRRVDYLGFFHVVLFCPDDVGLMQEAPAVRRAFLDRAVYHSRALHASELERYLAVLAQRNALFKNLPPRLDLLELYGEQLRQLGARIISARLDYLRLLEPYFQDAFAKIFGESRAVRFEYQASWMDRVELSMQLSTAQIEARLAAASAALRARELSRGSTLVGPHRDDLLLLLDNRPARSHASQGQQRALVLALKTSEINLLADRFETRPVLLLDDVSSELDPRRSAQLFAFLSGFNGQVFVTTSSAEYVKIQSPRIQWSVHEGEFSKALST